MCLARVFKQSRFSALLPSSRLFAYLLTKNNLFSLFFKFRLFTAKHKQKKHTGLYVLCAPIQQIKPLAGIQQLFSFKSSVLYHTLTYNSICIYKFVVQILHYCRLRSFDFTRQDFLTDAGAYFFGFVKTFGIVPSLFNCAV